MEEMDYNPNMVLSGNRAKQTVRLTFGMWKYRKTVEVVVGGNCQGFSVIDYAVEEVLDGLYGENEVASIILEHPVEGRLHCEDDENRQIEWLRNMLIGAEIVSIVPDGNLYTDNIHSDVDHSVQPSC